MSRRDWLASLPEPRRFEILEVMLYRHNAQNRAAIAEHVRRSGRVWREGEGP